MSTPAPVKPHRLRVRIADEGDRLRLSCRPRDLGGGCFMLLWLTGWTVGCVFLAGAVLNDPKFFLVLFAVPFWASWVFVFVMVLNAFFRREEMTLGRSGVEFTRRVLVPISSRRVPLDEVLGFRVAAAAPGREAPSRASAIEVRTVGQPLCVFRGVPDEELAWLAAQLGHCLQSLRPDGAAPAPWTDQEPPRQSAHAERAEAGPGAAEGTDAARPVAAETLRPAAQPPRPPSDCRWRREDEFAAVLFTQRGRASLGAVGTLLFVNLFWNGIVAVFVCSLFVPEMNGPQGPMWWGLVVFLIPFEAIGLVMFLVLLGLLLEPVRTAAWRFSDVAAEFHWTYLGVGPRWTWPVARLDRIELRPDAKGSVQGLRVSMSHEGAEESGAGHQLVFVDDHNAEVCAVGGLTEGEARWIGQVLLAERADWFR